MNNFTHYLTPEEAFRKDVVKGTALKEYQRLSNVKGKCFICEVEDIWKLADTDMCFSCTTGEADASGDYELKEVP